MYQIEGGDVLLEWLAHEPDLTRRQAMLDWMVEFATDPVRDARRLPAIRAPVYLVETAVARVTLTFLHAEQFHVVKLIEFGRLP